MGIMSQVETSADINEMETTHTRPQGCGKEEEQDVDLNETEPEIIEQSLNPEDVAVEELESDQSECELISEGSPKLQENSLFDGKSKEEISKIKMLKIIHEEEESYKKARHFQCEVCLRLFLKQKYLRHHMKSHEEAQFKCDLCGKGFVYKCNLERHYNIHLKAKFDCDFCTRQFTQKSHLKEHLDVHAGKYFECELCSKGFRRRSDLHRHRETHIGVRHKCPLCESTFAQRSYMNRHIKSHTKPKEKPALKPEPPENADKDICLEGLSESSLATVSDFKICMDNTFICGFCMKSFSRNSDLQRHLNIHMGIKFECHSCAKSFSRKADLKEHLKVHLGLNFPCDYCKKIFYRKSHLKRHLNLHIGVRYKCDVCQRTFAQKSYLTSHQRVHLQPDPLKMVAAEFEDSSSPLSMTPE